MKNAKQVATCCRVCSHYPVFEIDEACDADIRFQLVCKNCHLWAWGKSEAQVIRKWNAGDSVVNGQKAI